MDRIPRPRVEKLKKAQKVLKEMYRVLPLEKHEALGGDVDRGGQGKAFTGVLGTIPSKTNNRWLESNTETILNSKINLYAREQKPGVQWLCLPTCLEVGLVTFQ